MFRNILFILFACLAVACRCLAADASAQAEPTSGKSAVVDFEKQVREIAEKTAAEEKERKEQARLAKLNAPAVGSGEAFKIFKYRKDGAVVFADSAPYKTHYDVIVYNSCYACSITSKIDWHNTRLHLTEFGDSIALAAQQHNVDSALIRAVIHAESAFNPLARSRKGATGLMQLMPGTAKDMGVTDATVPSQNIQGGVKYLAYLLQKFSGNQTLAAAAYNAGPTAVTRHGGVPPYEETQTYVKRVRILFERYKNQKVLATN